MKPFITTLGINDFPVQNQGQWFSGDAMQDSELIEALVGTTSAGKVVTRDTAMRVTTFLGAIRMICSDYAQQPIVLYKTFDEVNPVTKKTTRRTVKAEDEQLYALLKYRPNPWMTPYQFKWRICFDLHFSNHAYIQVVRDGLGNPIMLMPLDPWCVTERWEPKEPELYFDYTSGETTRSFAAQDREIWHMSLLETHDCRRRGLLAFAKEALGVLQAAQETAGRYFGHGFQSLGYLTNAKDAAPLKKPDADSLTERVARMSGSRHSHQIPYFPGSIEFKTLSLNAEETQFMQSRSWQAEEIVRMIGGQPLLTIYGGKDVQGYNATSAQIQAYYTKVIAPLSVNVEDTILRDLIVPEDQGRLFAKHNADVILRGDPKERAETYEIQLRSGQVSPAWVDEKEDRDPQEGMDFRYVPQNSAIYDPASRKFINPLGSTSTTTTTTMTGAGGTLAEVNPAFVKANEAVDRLQAIAEKQVNRVLRKEEKALAKLDAEFVADALSIELDVAQNYVQQRKEGKISAEQAKAVLLALALGEQPNVEPIESPSE